MDTSIIRRVQCDNREIEYHLIRKSVKNINLRIKSDGTVCVSAHRRVPVTYIEAFIKQKQGWIIKALEKCEMNKRKQPIEKQYVEGEQYDFMGNQFALKVIESSEESVVIEKDTLVLQVKNQHDIKRKEKLLNHWFQARREEVFDEIAQEIYPLFERYHIEYPTIKIRRMKARWGSCQYRRGVVILNSRLIEKSREYIQYVLVHEFAHFIQPNHSKEFYKVVEEVMPNWKGIVAHEKEKSFSYS